MKIINPTAKKINFGGEIVEVAFVPAKVTLDAAKVSDGMKNGTMSEYEGSEQMLVMIETICKKSNPLITRDWLLENASMQMMTEFMEYVVGGPSDSVKTTQVGNSEKN
jgi:hypothetical protein